LYGWLPYGAIATLLTKIIFPQNENYAVLLLLPWMIGFAIAGYRLANFVCPRCAKRFGRNDISFISLSLKPQELGYYGWGIFSSKCSNCGLPKYAEGD
jgi:hypothetical protein